MKKLIGALIVGGMLLFAVNPAKAEGMYSSSKIAQAIGMDQQSTNFGGVQLGILLGYHSLEAGGLNRDATEFGGYLGYNWHFKSGLVLGVEADASMLFNLDAAVDDLTYISTRAKVGWAMGNLMPYATLGYGWATADVFFTDIDAHGIVWGLGADWRPFSSKQISLRAEWLRYEFDVSGVGPIDISDDTFRMGLGVSF